MAWQDILIRLSLSLLIYVEKFEFENPAFMEDKGSKPIERFSVTAIKRKRLFFVLDDKSKK